MNNLKKFGKPFPFEETPFTFKTAIYPTFLHRPEERQMSSFEMAGKNCHRTKEHVTFWTRMCQHYSSFTVTGRVISNYYFQQQYESNWCFEIQILPDSWSQSATVYIRGFLLAYLLAPFVWLYNIFCYSLLLALIIETNLNLLPAHYL